MKLKLSRHKSPTPQTLIVRASLLAGAVSMPQISRLKIPGSLSGAAGPGKPSVAGDQPEDYDATAVGQHRVADGDGTSSSTINYFSNPEYVVSFLLPHGDHLLISSFTHNA
jgi:hypothetical protein